MLMYNNNPMNQMMYNKPINNMPYTPIDPNINPQMMMFNKQTINNRKFDDR